jgi:exodeoxyribonuclease III
MKLISWNVNGIRAIMKKDFVKSIKEINPDVLCLQETKINEKLHPDELNEYISFWNFAQKKGYSGTAIFTKIKPIKVAYGLDIEEHDSEGRLITLEFENFFLINVYVPNSGRGVDRLAYRENWDKELLNYINNLEKIKPVILCGDMNVAHRDIDLKNPKSNYNKSAGYMQEEIDGMNNYTGYFIDTFRYKYPNEIKYSWWSYMFQARKKNIGWRIDYFLISKKLKDKIKDAFILNEYHGSDHCPVGIIL